jgi:hypothetical protein
VCDRGAGHELSFAFLCLPLLPFAFLCFPLFSFAFLCFPLLSFAFFCFPLLPFAFFYDLKRRSIDAGQVKAVQHYPATTTTTSF